MFRLILFIGITASALGAPHSHHIQSRLNGRIIGGDDVDIKNYPYMASILWYDMVMCAGAILDELHIITAGQCTFHYDDDLFTVRLNSSLLHDGGIEVGVDKVIVHPQFEYYGLFYDAAIFELSEPLQFGDGIAPVILPSIDIEDGANVNITGFGSTTGDPGLSSTLKAIEVPIIGRDYCKRVYGDTITENKICHGLAEGGKDACYYDAGAPLVANGTLYGLVSIGYCGAAGRPGINTDVFDILDFINSTLSR